MGKGRSINWPIPTHQHQCYSSYSFYSCIYFVHEISGVDLVPEGSLPHLLDVAEADAGPPLLHPGPHPGVQLDAPLLDVVAHPHTRSRAEVTHPGDGAAAW